MPSHLSSGRTVIDKAHASPAGRTYSSKGKIPKKSSQTATLKRMVSPEQDSTQLLTVTFLCKLVLVSTRTSQSNLLYSPGKQHKKLK